MTFTEEQAVRSKITGAEGTVLRSLDLVLVQMHGEHVMMSASQLEVIPPPQIPPPVIRPGVEVICISAWWCEGQIGVVFDRIGDRVRIDWDKNHWKYAGQADGWYPVDNFSVYQRMADAA